MNRDTLALASGLLVVTMLAAAIGIALSTPADLMLPTHFGLDGIPDRFSGKWTALLLPPLFTFFLSVFLYVLPALEPRQKGLARSQGLYLWGWAAMLLVLAVMMVTIASPALGWQPPVMRLVTLALAAMFVLVGNQLGKSRSMYLIGIRTPWTLASEEVWIRTHRFGGRLMVGGGLVLAAAALLVRVPSLGPLTLIVVGLSAAIPVVVSYLLWRRERAGSPPRG